MADEISQTTDDKLTVSDQVTRLVGERKLLAFVIACGAICWLGRTTPDTACQSIVFALGIMCGANAVTYFSKREG